MDPESTKTIIELLTSLLAKPDGTAIAAKITVGGMVGVALVTAATQLLATRAVMRSEHKRLLTQVNSNFRSQQFAWWQDEFVDAISKLLASTDPELYARPEPQAVIPLIHRAQLLLNVHKADHLKVRKLISELGKAVNGWEERTPSEVLRIHSELLEAASRTIYLPGR